MEARLVAVRPFGRGSGGYHAKAGPARGFLFEQGCFRMAQQKPRNRIRAYTRWSGDRDERIKQAKAELSAALCVQRLGEQLPEDLVCWSNAAFDLLEKEQVPMSEWE